MLIINGDDNPLAVNHIWTGTTSLADISEVTHNDEVVWSRSSAPSYATPAIEQLYIQGRDYAAVFNNGTFLEWSTNTENGVSYLRPRYSFESSTFWLYMKQYEAATKNSDTSVTWGNYALDSRSKTWSVTGLPSNLRVDYIPMLSIDSPFHVRRSSSDERPVADLPVETRRCTVNFFSLGETPNHAPFNANVNIYSTEDEAALYVLGTAYEIGTGNIKPYMEWRS